jgi:virginiamycin B lyase
MKSMPTRKQVIGGVMVVALCVSGLSLAARPAQAAFTIHEYPTVTPDTSPAGLALGKDGNLWFSEKATSTAVAQIARITPLGAVTEFPIGLANSYPLDVTAGPDGNVWFADRGTNEIGRITTSGTVTEFPIHTPSADLVGIASGLGKLWFTEETGNRIGSITTTGVVKEYLIGTKANQPQEIAAGPDGNMWFTEGLTHRIGRITPTGKITQFSTGSTQRFPEGICAGPDGNLWFADEGTNSIGRMTTAGSVTEFPVPGADGEPYGIASGPDGSLWFTQPGTSFVGQMNASGTVLSETPTPTVDSQPTHISPGSDGDIWFTEFNASDIGQLVLPHFNILDVFYIPNRFFIANETTPGSQGETVTWMGLNPGIHAVVDASGMGLFGFSPSGGPIPLVIGQTVSFTFNWAGTYAYQDPYQTRATGMVRVPITVQTVAGTTDEAQVTWASSDAPAGYAFDVQVLVPGNAEFTDWQVDTTSLNAVFGPSSAPWAGPGTYKFRAALINLGNGAASGFSRPTAISLR